jgi:[protein-PII] uridylyltransferase
MADVPELIAAARQMLRTEQLLLRAAYEKDNSAIGFLQGRARLVDCMLRTLWSNMDMPENVALVALGGYGRNQLYPCSDVDLLFLMPEDDTAPCLLEPLVGLLWDIGLDIGHSVRTISECLNEAERDITVQTALMEARLICGNRILYRKFSTRFAAHLDPAAFFTAKQLEQAERYARFNETPYSLEPNCKESPGGLRDLQTILWTAQAAKLGSNWRTLARTVALTPEETRQLARTESFLRHLRIRLHHIVGRRENRLSFEHQEALARSFHIQCTATRRAAEVLMQHYYRNAKLVTQLNTLVLQQISLAITPAPAATPVVIDARFQITCDLLDIRRDTLFADEPQAILEAFLLMADRSELHGMTVRTLRALWQAGRRSSAALRSATRAPELFLQIFQHDRGLVHELQRMNQYGILGQYLPAFGRIVGQMQHDLFHVYTVDQHILQVIRNLRRFAAPEFAHEYPFCTRLLTEFDKPWLLYLAALFHDIAKGRSCDHSRLGMADARRFCKRHGITGEDASLIVFLVGQHLTMSQVAQKQDLADPQVIGAFAAIAGTERRLVALYLLSVADIRGTGPKVWSAWKGMLLEDLFQATARFLRGDAPLQMAGVSERQKETRVLLRLYGLRPDSEIPFWQQLDTSYFLRHDADEITWHTRTLHHRPATAEPITHARINPSGDGIQVMIYLPDQPNLFARVCGFFARHGMSIATAKVHTTLHGYALDSFVLLIPDEEAQTYRDIISFIEHNLTTCLKAQQPLAAPPPARLSRQVKHFPIAPEILIQPDECGTRYIMSITAVDRPGLLYSLARILSRHDIFIHSAKIATFGERIEDTFLISGNELSKTATLVHLEQELLAALQVS